MANVGYKNAAKVDPDFLVNSWNHAIWTMEVEKGNGEGSRQGIC